MWPGGAGPVWLPRSVGSAHPRGGRDPTVALSRNLPSGRPHAEFSQAAHAAADTEATVMRSSARGFTLIEIMIVVAMVAILSAVAVPAYTEYAIRGCVPNARGS